MEVSSMFKTFPLTKMRDVKFMNAPNLILTDRNEAHFVI